MAGHADKAAHRGGRAADIEHGVEHPGHRAGGAGAHRDQQRPAPVAEALAGGAFEIVDSFGEPVGRLCAAPRHRRARSRRKARPAARRPAAPAGRARRRARGSPPSRRSSRRNAARSIRSPIRTISMARHSSRKIGEHVLAQQMAEAGQLVGRALDRAGELEHRQRGLQIEFAASG